MRRFIIIVMDSAGVGEMPDAADYGDKGSSTIPNIAQKYPGFSLPNLGKLGLGNIAAIKGVPAVKSPLASYGKMAEASPGKDTTTGHWEIAGIRLEKPFPVYPSGFPADILKTFEAETGRKTLGNEVASGTEIIDRLGAEHVRTGKPIVYTSADSVFQIAAHVDVIPLDELYEMCATARKILMGEHAVGRVIARPFNGTTGRFERTADRRDYSLDPVAETLLDAVSGKGMDVRAVGKISDIFNGRGITHSIKTHTNTEGVKATVDWLEESFSGLVFTNLVDFDMLYGHRNNIKGYAEALMQFDREIPDVLDALSQDDILVLTADHGCDPTTKSTDHSREYVPLLVYGRSVKPGEALGTRKTFADIAASAAEYLGIARTYGANSFLDRTGF
ncbi:MAG: phosphopentomutase [Eubacteriales bacterium]|nr:phosphopentomutase [Eubacteriales bacterium]